MKFLSVAAFSVLLFQAISLNEQEQVHDDILDFEN